MSDSNQSFNFVEAEHSVLNFWHQNQIFEKSLEKTRKGQPYIFYDGPPFATGLPHHGHLVGSTLKDVIPRYFTMKGRFVDRRFGWDCHGLPIEHEIDKKLGMSAQEAVEKLGVKKYNDECRGIVQKYTTEWKKTIDRIGRWVSFERQYRTMDTDFMESVWWVFKSLWDKDLIYQSTKVMPFSTALGTVLSNFEAGSNYQTVQDTATTVLFKLNDSEDYIAAWTTTPWTLPSNLGLCVNKEIDYALVEDSKLSLRYYIAKERIETYEKKLLKRELKIINEVKGSQLVGKKYEPLFSYFSDKKEKGAFQIFEDDYVTIENGTGIVHTAPSFGEDDERVMKKNDIHLDVCPVTANGFFTEEVSDFKGRLVTDKQTNRDIINWLKEKNKWLEDHSYSHSYPHCPRSHTPLIYRAIPSWYVSVEKIKDQMIASNQQINWVPDHLRDGRFGKWLENAKDWAISRNRVWGTPIPIWYNETTKKHLCVGSIEELKKLSGTELKDLHREYVDDLPIKIAGEDGEYRRIPEVLDCWFESGSMPYAQLHYPFENREIFEAGFPAEYIAEGLDQTRGWFYTLTVLSSALFKKPAFKNVIVNGLVLAEDGKKMSKSLRNFTSPDILMENFGADALRLFLINSALVKAEDLRFSDEGVKDMVRRVLLPWYNCFKFLKTYIDVDQWKPTSEKDFKPTHILDQWILSKLQTLIDQVNHEMGKYHLYNVIPALFEFIDDLTNWYIRLNRKRFWAENSDAKMKQDKEEAYQTLYTTIKVLGELMAPFAPFLSEHLYQELKDLDPASELSVHLCAYPEANEKLRNPTLEDAVKRMQEIILLGRQKRIQEKVKVKIPLRSLKVIHQEKAILEEIKKLETPIKTELNVKEIQYDTDELKYIKFYALPNSPVLGKKLGKEFGKYRKAIGELSSEEIKKLEDSGELAIMGRNFSLEEILLYREPLENIDSLSNRFISIDFPCKLDSELIQEGMAREVVNRIQKTRKEINFNVEDRIKVQCQCDEELKEIIQKHWEYIAKETLSTELEFGNANEYTYQYDINDHDLKLNLIKVS
ncbi:MAG: isoleucine--tRNA ligase [Halobacteriovoraceae bacterium]|nr:isoleucine--tRNA ligase [Halobacteriovoraceae bacterium]